ncbi:MAG TPA: hypothetical protein VGO81_06530 [Solirubrobacteraceae bacterium]|jgi:uncharacterized membrane protein YeaQ/YmgE (transglycosylase-associated protein family)|nr:hypothetical protein [Solirubrobacteraceae bacterium]
MSVIGYIIVLLLVGLVVGALARLALPGRDPMTIPQTIAIGVAGSFIAGLIGALLFGRGAGGLLLSVICSAAIVYFIRRSRGGGLMDPGIPPE